VTWSFSKGLNVGFESSDTHWSPLPEKRFRRLSKTAQAENDQSIKYPMAAVPPGSRGLLFGNRHLPGPTGPEMLQNSRRRPSLAQWRPKDETGSIGWPAKPRKFFSIWLEPARHPQRHRFTSRMQTTSDEVLIERIAGGDRLAMKVLFARHHVRVYRFVLRMVRNEATAEDLISEVFLDVWRQAEKFEGRSSVSTWMLSIARFKALSALRRRSEEELDDETADAIEDQADDPEVALAKKDKGAALRQCLTRLSAEHREIIDLVYYHEKSVEEVAGIVGIPEATVKTRMFYARKKLAELLKEQGIDRGWP
jgi:RNA polymerase sigma-70 factor, ECF subfamily